MYVIAEIGGKQFKLQADQKVYIPKVENNVDDTITFDRVLLVSSDDSVQVGLPTVSGASVTARVLAHVKGDKVIIFKKKRRKGYRLKNGHRQQFTQVQVSDLKVGQ